MLLQSVCITRKNEYYFPSRLFYSVVFTSRQISGDSTRHQKNAPWANYGTRRAQSFSALFSKHLNSRVKRQSPVYHACDVSYVWGQSVGSFAKTNANCLIRTNGFLDHFLRKIYLRIGYEYVRSGKCQRFLTFFCPQSLSAMSLMVQYGFRLKWPTVSRSKPGISLIDCSSLESFSIYNSRLA